MHATIGTLNDEQIRSAAEKGELISGGYAAAQVKQACYDLRAGSVYYQLGNNHVIDPREVKCELTPDTPLVLRPRQMVVVITQERLNIPANVIARILTKGVLFSMGVSSVSTYADPGFKGNMGITLVNHSNGYITIDYGRAIAKVEFSVLAEPVKEPYSGRHGNDGYDERMWEIPYDCIQSYQQAKDADTAGVGTVLEEIEATHGEVIGRLVRRLYRFENRALLVGMASLVIGAIALYLGSGLKWIPALTAVLIGLTSAVVAQLAMWFITSARGR